MPNWHLLLALDSSSQQKVKQLYPAPFMIELRRVFSEWIESKDWASAVNNKDEAGCHFNELMNLLEEKHNQSIQEATVLSGPDFEGIKKYLQSQFQDSAVNLASILCNTLMEESIIHDATYDTQHDAPSNTAMESHTELANNIETLKNLIETAERKVSGLHQQREQYISSWKAWQDQVSNLGESAPSHDLQEQHIQARFNLLNQNRRETDTMMEGILNTAENSVWNPLSVELCEWKLRQQKACIGAATDTCLDQLQTWFTTVAECLQQLCHLLKNLTDQEQSKNNLERSLCLLKRLLQSALVVEKQPCMAEHQDRPLLLKTKVSFTVKIRFLANLPEFRPEVELIFDRDLTGSRVVPGYRKFLLSPIRSSHCKVFDVDATGVLGAEFGPYKLKPDPTQGNRSNQQSSVIVTEELHNFVFATKLQLPGLEVDIETSSLPLVVISGSTQVTSAWASVMWYNMLNSEPVVLNPLFFVDPPPAPWHKLAEVLSWQFSSISKQGLDDDQLCMLREKFVDSDDLVHWNKFCKSDGNWTWIVGILDLIKKYLLDYWNEGYIKGFISKTRTDALLKSKPTGTFMIRFSESIKEGAITFSWVEHVNDHSYVTPVRPFMKSELKIKSLANSIRDFKSKCSRNQLTAPLLYLYPDIPKDCALGKYYTSNESENVDGYVKREKLNVSESRSPSPCLDDDMEIQNLLLSPFDVESLESYLHGQCSPTCGLMQACA